MKEVKVICSKCGATTHFKNWFYWIWLCPFHWFGKRLVKCGLCKKKSYMKRVK